ncbi:MAG: polyprenyl synthetase family protein [Acidobacteriota bacterium]
MRDLRVQEATTEASIAPDSNRLHHDFLQRWWPAIEAEITDVLGAEQTPSPLDRMTAYQLGTGGKRLRALLPLRIAEVLGYDPERMVPFAAACEVLHNASLILDDIQDGDSMRRGREAVWRHFGVSQGINVSIAMMYYAPLLVRRLDVSPELCERVLQIVLTKTLDVIRGQSLELSIRRAVPVTWGQYVEIVDGKTGGLLYLPIVGAAILSGASEATTVALGEAARHLAVLFQLQDDLVDLWGEKGRGRVGNDIREGKPSALVAFALARLSRDEALHLFQVLEQPRDETSDEDVAEIIVLFESCGARDRVLDEVIERRRAAISVLEDPVLRDFVSELVALMTAPIAPLLHAHEQTGSVGVASMAGTELGEPLSSVLLTIATVPKLCHPEIDRVQQLAKERSEALGIVIPRFYDAHASMSSFLYSSAPVDRVVTTTLFNSLLFYIDDVLGEDIIGAQSSGSLAARVMAVWQGQSLESCEPEPIGTVLAAVEAVRDDILSKSNEPFFRRLTKSIAGHLQHVFQPRSYRSLEEYLQTRAHFSGMYPTLIMSELVADAYLDDAILESVPWLRCAEGACVHIGGLSNDLFSYPKERHSAFNLVNAQLKLGLVSTLEDAVRASIELVNRYHEVYRESIEQARVTLEHLSSGSRQTAEAYIDGMDNILSASYHWQRFTERYRHPDHFFTDMR